MPAYLIQLPRERSGYNLIHDADAVVVFAANTAAARQMAAARHNSDGAAWVNDATVTTIASGANWVGWTFRVSILGGFGAGGNESRTVFVAGSGVNDLIDEVAAALVAALNALDGIDNASYNSVTNVLTIAGGLDGLGNQKVAVDITPPDGKSPIAALVGTIVDGGAPGDALTVVLPADGITVIPAVFASLKQVE